MTTHLRRSVPAFLLGATAMATASLHGTASLAAPAKPPVVVELFQSQGCSDCPPAQENLNRLADRPDVLALSFGVSYWDYLGWKDSFASPQFTQRQRDYSAANNGAGVATPQYWINGRQTVLGANPARVAQLIAQGGPRGPSILLADDRVQIGQGAAPKGGADILLVRYDPRTIAVPIRAGENGGRTVAHRDIVRELVRIGRWNGGPQAVRLPASRVPGLRTAILVQAGKGGPIIAAAKG
ncbi:DUF1223 domain-containing protein [Sphingomonas morindae]|uniref:DUF1223 domain-containing protein n=1 Tax=Sphingomonas morindae TaxID=1541170 RepID=A0ABY4X9S9_9SPHN|nr:DUF1223 domain-containing protein [Sphingomonas morindae]USI73491.1 DUF1223 domain-containing protein [Sphingomonas morindae]